jgi:hypothetical protein
MTTTERLPEVTEAGSRPPNRRWIVAAVMAALVALVAGVLVIANDDEPDGAPPSTVPTTAAAPTSTRPPSTVPPSVDRSTAVWPFADAAGRHTDPVAAARDFAVSFLRFTAPVVGAFQQGDSRSGEVEVRPVGNGPATTVLLRRLSGEETWSVLGTATADIELSRPEAGTVISSPVPLAGRARAFEGTVQVEVRQDGDLRPIGTGFVTGGGDIMRPFQGEVAFTAPRSRYGALVLFTESAENGQVWQAAVVRVRLGTSPQDSATCGAYRSPRPALTPDQMEVRIYFNCDRDGGDVSLHPAYRAVPRSAGVLRASLEALLAGPTAAEREATLGSWFSADTAGMLRSVSMRDGHAVVDFRDLRPVIPNASSSAGSVRLLSQLDGTVFQFPSVRSVEYRIDGSCEAFTEWLQIGGCDRRTRDEVLD